MAKEPKKVKVILTKAVRRAEHVSQDSDRVVAKIVPAGTVFETNPVDANELIFSNKAFEYSPEVEKAVKAEIKAKEEAKAAAERTVKAAKEAK